MFKYGQFDQISYRSGHISVGLNVINPNQYVTTRIIAKGFVHCNFSQIYKYIKVLANLYLLMYFFSFE